MRNKWLWISLLLVTLVVFIAACGQQTASPTQNDTTTVENTSTEVDVEALIVERCSRCHTPDRAFNANYDEQGWSDVIDKMIQYGADVSDDEKAMMIDWLISR